MVNSIRKTDATGARRANSSVPGEGKTTPAGDENTVIKITPVAVPRLAEPAYYGVVGDFLRAVDPYTEATDAGVLAHFLPAVGALAGPGVYVWAGNKQYAR